MRELIEIIFFSYLGGATIFIGGLIASRQWLSKGTARTTCLHSLVGFGGGLLLAAVSLVLVPLALETLHFIPLSLSFLTGGVVFCFIDASLTAKGGDKSQLLAMMMDFMPEAISMGAVFSVNHKIGILLCIFMAAQNLPEGFNAARELSDSGWKNSRILMSMFLLTFAGVIAALTGKFLLSSHPLTVAVLMSFAAGGILYLIFQDIAPQTQMKKSWIPPLGAIVGFTIGMICEKIVNGG